VRAVYQKCEYTNSASVYNKHLEAKTEAVDNRAQGPDRRSAGAENQDFQLRTRRRRVPATATAHISAITYFFANFRELSKFYSKTYYG